MGSLKIPKSLGTIMVMSFLMSVVASFFSIMLAKAIAPEDAKNPGALYEGGLRSFWHMIHVQSDAMAQSFVFNFFMTSIALWVYATMTAGQGGFNSPY